MFVKKNFLVIVILLSVIFAVAMKATIFQKDPAPPASPVPAGSAEFRTYWLSGRAESTRYALEQTVSGIVKTGVARLLFNVEDFRTDRQVRATSEAGHDKAIPVLKNSLIYTFVGDSLATSLFTSVFTPITNGKDRPPIFLNTLKMNYATQSDSGTSYLQVNLRNNGYQVLGHSFAEEAADETYRIDNVLLEDELYNRIRLNPGKLPVGTVQLVPGVVSSRLRHKKLEPRLATTKLEFREAKAWFGDSTKNLVQTDSLQMYTVAYTQDARKLTIVFDRAFPFRIMGWEEIYTDAGKTVTTKATLLKAVRHVNQ